MTKKRILVVEDQAIIAMDEQQIVSDLGYAVTGFAMTGEDAIQQAGRDRPDLVLMDIQLMGDMDGREAASQIREMYQIPVLFVTAYGDKQSSVAGNFTVPAGYGYIVKPYSKQEFESEIKRLIG